MIVNNKFHFYNIVAIIGVICLSPVLYFVSFNILKYKIGLFPNMEILTFHPAVLLGGGMIAILLNLWSIFDFRVLHQEDKIWLSFGFTNRPLNIIILGTATVLILVLVSYVALENIGFLLGS